MEIVEKLSSDLILQLEALYRKFWFTQSRTASDIKVMLDNSYLTLAFIKDGQLIGFCRVISDGVYKAFIFDVIVEPEFQNKGVGKFIMSNVINHKALKGILHIELYCPEIISHFYKKIGFHVRSSLLLRYTQD